MVLGPYTLTRKLGQGGFGSVWLADQSSPVKREVALKILSPGRVSEEVIARFEQERQALAVMDHPNIARIFDAGTTDSGLPYFAMEVVHGQPITRYCDERRLPLRDRLALFIPVCRAVQHAHAKGIVHRDLKPSNVLVAEHDGKPVPKVIDFGIAKAIGVRPDAESGLTLEGQMIGTPVYMSPEQVSGRTDVDTRSDVYSLGALLYELLVGITPVDPKTLRQAGWAEMERLICELDPPRPSERAAGREEETASFRQTNTMHLVKKLRGELDWIVMRAIEKDRERRYETANALAAELRRFLNNEPVLAGPPSVSYRLGKFVRRQKGPLSAAVALFVVSLAGTAVSWWQAEVAKEQAELAKNESKRAGNAEKVAEQAASLADKRAETIRQNLYFAQMNLAAEAADRPDGLTRVAELTRDWRPTTDSKDLRGWEWYYLDSLLHQDVATLRGHTGSVESVVYSPDGKTLATAGDDRDIRIWDAKTRTGLRVLRGHQSSVRQIAWSPDGTRLASASWDKTIRIWDALTGVELSQLGTQGAVVDSVSWSPDGNYVASGSGDRMGRIWNTKTGQASQTFVGSLQSTTSGTVRPCWQPKGSVLAIVQGGTTPRFLDVATGALIQTVGDSGGGFCWNPDGSRFAMSSAQRISVWDARAWRLVLALPGHEGSSIRTTCWSPDGRELASAGEDHSIRIWDTVKGTQLGLLRGHLAEVRSVDWSPDGMKLVSGSNDGTVKLWELQPKLNPAGWNHLNRIGSVSWHPDGKRFAVGGIHNDAPMLAIWDVVRAAMSRELPTPSDRIGASSCAWSPNGQRLASINPDHMMTIWNPDSGVEIERLKQSDANSSGNGKPPIAWSPDGTRLACREQRKLQTLVIYETATHREMARLPTRDLRSIAWHPDGKAIALSDEGKFKVWETTTWTELITKSVFAQLGNVFSICWSPDGTRVATGASAGKVSVWDAATGTELLQLKGHTQHVLAVSWNPDGSRLAGGGVGRKVWIWDTKTGAQALSLSGHTDQVTSLAWSPDGTRLLTGGLDRMILWDASKSYELERERQTQEAEP